MPNDRPRYEFRVWANSLEQLKTKLDHLATPGQPVTSDELYLISRASDRCSAKIRSGLMNIKILVKEDRGLEQWEPVLKASFPLDQAVVNAQIFPYLALERPRLFRASYQMDQFLDEVIGVDRRIALVKISKERCRFAIDACQAEFAAVTISKTSRHTVAVESTEPEAALRLIGQMGIQDLVNTSYVREIKRIVGMPEA